MTARGLQPLMVWPDAMRDRAWAPSRCIEDLLVIDPACGDGEFLAAALDLLAPLLVEARQLEGAPIDDAEARLRIARSCLVGVDVDPGAIAAARERLGPECRLECKDAILDWHFDTARRPTAFVGNPPFLGGGKISGTFGTGYQKRLLAEYRPSSNGGADLATYFFLLAFRVLEEGKSLGTVSFVATNTISQGRTREAGLCYLLQKRGAKIYCADRSLRWPGDANVSVSIVHLAERRLTERLWPATG